MVNPESSEVDNLEQSPWKRIAGKEVGKYAQRETVKNESDLVLKSSPAVTSILKRVNTSLSRLFINAVHRLARIANRPVVDIGREYSVSTLNDRINTLEEILVRQWTQARESDFISPNDEIRQYIAACHVARQYDRITPELLSNRLGISEYKSEMLIEQLVVDEIITEGYAVTYHDVRRSMIDATIERKLADAHKVENKKVVRQHSSKKH